MYDFWFLKPDYYQFYLSRFSSSLTEQNRQDMNTSVFDELAFESQLYNRVTERLDVPSYAQDGPCSAVEFDRSLIELILEFYDKEEESLYPQMRKYSPLQILNYLKATHRYYLTKLLPEIEQSMLHVFTRYPNGHSLLSALALFFNEYKEKLVEHIRAEETHFFPYAYQLICAQNAHAANTDLQALISNSPLRNIKENHHSIEDELDEVSRIIKSYSVEGEVPFPYRIFLTQVELFAVELRKHALIEDYVFLPMMLEMEEKMATH